MRVLTPLCCCALLAASESAEVVVSSLALRSAEQAPPLGVNSFGGMGGIDWATNNFLPNPGNEPVVWRNLHRVRSVAADGLLTIDGGGTSWYQLWNSGFLSGADVRIYRLVDAEGRPLPLVGGNPDPARAVRMVLVGRTRVAPEGAPGLPDGGWLAESWGSPHPNLRFAAANCSVTDLTPENGREYWYSVVAIGADGKESALAEAVSATPRAGADAGPVLHLPAGDHVKDAVPGAPLRLALRAAGGTPPLTWSAAAGTLPEGLVLNPATGLLSGRTPAAGTEAHAAGVQIGIQVTDAAGRRAERILVLLPGTTAGNGAAAAPTGLMASARDGAVTLSWQRAAGAVAYSLRRSTRPPGKQRDGILLASGAPAVVPGDYLVLQRAFDGIPPMRLVHPRVRGMDGHFDRPALHWQTNRAANELALVPHPLPVPAEMADPGRTCLQVKAGAGRQELFHFTCISPGRGAESQWYGHFEPGCTYHLELWMRQEGLAEGGKVVFDLRGQLPQVATAWTVDGTWRKYVYDFTAPAPPTSCWHYGPQLVFSGPGTLWLDNGRLGRIDRPEDASRPYVPGRLALDGLLASQPATGRKGSHRIWFLERDATMEGITSWHANSRWRPDWNTSVGRALGMTLPMGLEFELATGDKPETRVRPWLVLQHLLHSEDDWRGLIEYLAAPYDPALDTPQAKPWAHRRFAQRGHGRPWTAEFASIAIQFGNETWHNGVFEDWIGFSWRNAVWQGGREYGLAMQYLCDEIRKSPYWEQEKLDGKLRFVLDGGYVQNDPNPDGTLKPGGYGGQAMRASSTPAWLTQANYVGPKWETGDKAASTFSDPGLQEVLLGWVASVQAKQEDMSATWKLLASQGRSYELTAYEGGPSSFELPGKGTPESVETCERYGKSQAMAVAALDAWLGSYLQGWTEQCYFSYGMGLRWNSHTVVHDGFRPSPAWLALTLRNRFARGAMMRTEVVRTPLIAKGGARLPLVGAYALRDGGRWSVFLLSRSLTERIPVTIRLPFQAAGAVSLHRLAADPRASNRQRQEVAIESCELPAAAVDRGVLEVEGGLPPGAIHLYVCEETR
jgi:hypothetical protein